MDYDYLTKKIKENSVIMNRSENNQDVFDIIDTLKNSNIEYDPLFEQIFTEALLYKIDNIQDVIKVIDMMNNIGHNEKLNLPEYMNKIINIIVKLINDDDNFWYTIRSKFNANVGWAIPSDKAIKTIASWVNEYADFQKTQHNIITTKLVDVGAGSGIWELLLHNRGVHADKLLSIDLPNEKKTHKFKHVYWDIQEIENYSVDINDILFVAWGYGVRNIIDDYVNRGGKCVILLGEQEGGCTSPGTDYFENKKDWIVFEVYVVAGMSCIPECLTLNVLKQNN